MKKKILLILPFIWVYALQAQQINTCGGSTLENDFSAEWIIGGSLIDDSMFEEGEFITEFSEETYNFGLIDVNPTATMDFLTITSRNEIDPTLNYRIINGVGNTLLNGILNTATPLILDVENLAAGYYLIIFSSANDNTFLVTKKFIKL